MEISDWRHESLLTFWRFTNRIIIIIIIIIIISKNPDKAEMAAKCLHVCVSNN